MAKLIVKAKYYNGKTHNMGGYLKYIATREGVEKIDESRKYLPVTRKQKDLISRILQDFPDAKEMLEYEDYIKAPTVGSASEFITRVLEDNAPEIMDMDGKTYADYIATRPGAERFGKHGLFGNDGEAIDLEAVSEELNAYTGNVHTLIISLRREDAARLGFDAGVRWRDMLRTQTETLAKNYKIPMENLRWYAAYHNEGHHPHVHVMVWSNQSGQAYLTGKGLKSIKASLAHDIFHQDLSCVYERQTEYRDELRQEAREQAADIAQRIVSGSYDNSELAERLQTLARMLKESAGKQVYKFLKPEAKLLVDSIVNGLAEDERISSLFDLWYEQKEEVLRLYHTKLPPRVSLADCPEFLPIKNAVIREAAALGTVSPTPEAGASRLPRGDAPGKEDNFNGLTDADMESYLDSFTDEDAPPPIEDTGEYFDSFSDEDAPPPIEDMGEYFDGLTDEEAPLPKGDKKTPYAWYKQGKELMETDLQKAVELLTKAADADFVPACYLLGKVLSGGKSKDIPKALEYLEKAIGKDNAYAAYLAGKILLTEESVKDVPRAVELLKKAADANLVPACYLLGKVLSGGKSKDIPKALEYLEKAISKDNAYAAYLAGKILLTGESVKDVPRAVELLKKAADADLVPACYLLGKTLSGEDAKDIPKALEYLEKAINKDNAYAAYLAGKILLTEESVKDVSRAAELLEKAADAGVASAYYPLGKLLMSGEGVPQDIPKAAFWLEKAVAAGNPFAAYSLAGLYHRGEGVAQDDARAFSLYKMAAEDEKKPNAYAMYELGKMYATGTGTEINKAASVLWFQKAAAGLEPEAARGDSYAQYRLGTLYLFYLKDQEKAMTWLQASADGGNFYAQQLLQDIHSRNQMTAGSCVLRLFHFAGRILQNRITEKPQRSVDRKLRRKIAEKKLAQGLHLE